MPYYINKNKFTLYIKMSLNNSSYRKSILYILALRLFILFKWFRVIIHRYSLKISITFSILLIDFIKIQLYQIEIFISK